MLCSLASRTLSACCRCGFIEEAGHANRILRKPCVLPLPNTLRDWMVHCIAAQRQPQHHPDHLYDDPRHHWVECEAPPAAPSRTRWFRCSVCLTRSSASSSMNELACPCCTHQHMRHCLFFDGRWPHGLVCQTIFRSRWGLIPSRHARCDGHSGMRARLRFRAAKQAKRKRPV